MPDNVDNVETFVRASEDVASEILDLGGDDSSPAAGLRPANIIEPLAQPTPPGNVSTAALSDDWEDHDEGRLPLDVYAHAVFVDATIRWERLAPNLWVIEDFDRKEFCPNVSSFPNKEVAVN